MDDLIRGALVADAASLGMHWIYDVDRAREVGGARPEFLEPDLAHYRGGAGYFAHKGKRAGDLSHYGEQCRIAAESLGATGGAHDPQDHERRFVASFGPGGRWVGYIDYATRETLRNADDAERGALRAAHDFDLGPFESHRPHVESAVMANARKWSGAQLDQALEKATRIRGEEDADLIARVQAMGRAVVDARAGFHGSDDVQLPALTGLPAAVAHGADVESVVRVTNDNDEAVAWAHKIAALLRGEVEPAAIAGEGGIACPLDQSVPLIGRILAEADSYESGVRANILAGGDNCGRGIVVGAWLARKYPIPQAWLERVAGVS
ncbi:MAG: ADP-ribosylglycohydrolase family protein [Planctomycetota bacterium]